VSIFRIVGFVPGGPVAWVGDVGVVAEFRPKYPPWRWQPHPAQ